MTFNSKQQHEVTQYLEERYGAIVANYSENYQNTIILKAQKYQVLFFDFCFYNETNKFAALYLYDEYRGWGTYRELLKKLNEAGYSIATFEDCGLEKYYQRYNIEYTVFKPLKSYEIISSYYEGKRAKRTGLPYINHINEGCQLIDSDLVLAREAFMLHPIFQDGNQNNVDLSGINKGVIKLAEKYAKLANSYLPKDYESPAPKVNNEVLREMLLADKIQNYKDYKRYKHVFDEEKQNQLEIYFNNWFKTLNISLVGRNNLIEQISREIPVL